MNIQNINLDNKTVLVRVDYNVPTFENKIIDDKKIVASLKTINYLLEKNCKIILMSHMGKIKSEDDFANNSLKIVIPILEKLLNKKIKFASYEKEDIIKKVKLLKNKEVLLLENTRFRDIFNKEESSCSEELSKFYASLCDVFINDAFASSHRKHASTYGVTKYVESGIGFLIIEELKNLSNLVNNPKKPFTIVMGGKKVDDKIPVIKNLIEKCDYLLLGGAIANTFLYVKNYNVGKSIINKDLKEEIENILKNYRSKIYLPKDVVVGNNDDKNYFKLKKIDEVNDDEIIYDIGSETISLYKLILKKSKTVFLNGTMGKYEDEKFINGTKEIFKSLNRDNANIIVGGGDSVGAINTLGLNNCVSYLSTGGGATLEYLAKGYLEAIRKEDLK